MATLRLFNNNFFDPIFSDDYYSWPLTALDDAARNERILSRRKSQGGKGKGKGKGKELETDKDMRAEQQGKDEQSLVNHSQDDSSSNNNSLATMRRDRGLDWLGLGLGLGSSGGLGHVDVVESEREYRIHVDLPGVSPSDVDVTVANGQVHISGERKQLHEERCEFSHRIERSFGKVQRSVSIPESAQGDSAEARFENGVLTVVLSKKPAAQLSRKLEIKHSAAAAPAAPAAAPAPAVTASTTVSVPVDKEQ